MHHTYVLRGEDHVDLLATLEKGPIFGIHDMGFEGFAADFDFILDRRALVCQGRHFPR